jgi:hypothetical protein
MDDKGISIILSFIDPCQILSQLFSTLYQVVVCTDKTEARKVTWNHYSPIIPLPNLDAEDRLDALSKGLGWILINDHRYHSLFVVLFIAVLKSYLLDIC